MKSITAGAPVIGRLVQLLDVFDGSSVLLLTNAIFPVAALILSVLDMSGGGRLIPVAPESSPTR
jgi:hypothetical protein